MAARVDNVPLLLRPLWLAASWIVGFGFWVLILVLHVTCRIRIEGAPQGHFIYALWHRGWPIWFVAFARFRRHAWLQHPAAYMKPTHIFLELMGIRILLGSSGEEGRGAAANLATLLRDGWSTAISPDGPAGPPRSLKKGVLHIARDSGVPIIPVKLEVTPAIPFPTWDRKRLPLPFSRIVVVFGQPIQVTEENFDEAARALPAVL